MKETLILGIGNPFLSDDGVGTKVVLDLKGKLDNKFFDFAWEYTCSMDLINIIHGYKNLIVIDGKISPKSNPGEITLYRIDDYTGMAHLDNYHDISFGDLIRLSHKLGIETPKNIKIVAIEIAEDKLFSKDLSPPLQILYEKILHKVLMFTESISQTATTC